MTKECTNCIFALHGEPRTFMHECLGCRDKSSWKNKADFIVIHDEDGEHTVRVKGNACGM